MTARKLVACQQRTVPVLSAAQEQRQAVRLGQAVPSLAAAYSQALARWLGDPVLRLAGRPIITECYRSPERQNELYRQGRGRPGPVVTYTGRGIEAQLLPYPGAGRGFPAGRRVGIVVGATAEQVCPADEVRRCPGGVGRRLAFIQGPAALRGADGVERR